MAATQDQKDALDALTAAQIRVFTSSLGYQKNDRRCPICHYEYWNLGEDPSLSEQPVRTLCCSKVIGLDCFRIFLSPTAEGGGNSFECPICRHRLLEPWEAEENDRSSTVPSADFRRKVRAFQDFRRIQVEQFRLERARADCALYEELHDEGVKLPGPIGSKEPSFEGKVEPNQRIDGLSSNQYTALLLELQREGAFKPIDSHNCALNDAELYKNLRKARVFYQLKAARWENIYREPVFINRFGAIGTTQQLEREAKERLRSQEKANDRLSFLSRSSNPSRPSVSSSRFESLRRSESSSPPPQSYPSHSNSVRKRLEKLIGHQGGSVESQMQQPPF